MKTAHTHSLTGIQPATYQQLDTSLAQMTKAAVKLQYQQKFNHVEFCPSSQLSILK